MSVKDFPPEISRALDALGQEKRRKIVVLIAKEDVSFSDLVERAKSSPSTVNHHLKELIKASLIDNYYKKSANPGKKYSFYKLSEFGKDFCKALGIFEG